MTVSFPHTGRNVPGYDVEQVDEFFARARRAYEQQSDELDSEGIRAAAFDLVRPGYETSAVDGALDRLEAAFVQREHNEYAATHGEEAWLEYLREQAQTLYGRMNRPHNDRFRPPASGRGYSRVEVDALLDRLAAYFETGEPITSAEIRSAAFTSAKAVEAYEEGPVDAYLDRALGVLLAVE